MTPSIISNGIFIWYAFSAVSISTGIYSVLIGRVFLYRAETLKVGAEVLVLLFRTLEVLDRAYVSWFFLVHPGECRYYTLN
jgi:hypothetical protein